MKTTGAVAQGSGHGRDAATTCGKLSGGLITRGMAHPAPRRLLLLAVALYAAPARADCRCSVDASPCPPGATVQCDVETFDRTVDALLVAEHDRDVALAANRRMEEELRVRITPVEVAVWPWAAGGVVLGLVVGVLLAR